MNKKKIFSLLLGAVLCTNGFGTYAQTMRDIGETTQNVITQIPGTERTIKDMDKSFFSVTGFASVDSNVNDRTMYINTKYHRQVYNERDFLDALVGARDGQVKIIQLNTDLNLGWNELNLTSTEKKIYNFVYKYGNPSKGFTNPELQEAGVTKMKIGFLDGITIFSEKGNTIKHTEINLNRSSKDVIFRNITFDGMWQWDDTGAHKEVGWSLMKINGGKDIWFDHCTFTHAADGMIDMENGSSGVTLSWCKFGVEATENPDEDSQIYKSITHMETRYQNGDLVEGSRYRNLRDNGATMNEIMAYAAYHSKVNLNGSGDKDYVDYVNSSGIVTPDSNDRLEITVAYSKYSNVGQRVPMIRQGKGHLFNVYVDDSGHMDIHNNNPVFNTYGLYPLSRCINSRNGASIGADTCIFKGVEEVIIGSEKQGDDTGYMNPPWDVLFQNAHNNSLVVNSSVTNSTGTYVGSSWDDNGDNLFTLGFNWNDKSTIGKWAWSSTIVGRDGMHKDTPPTEPFQFIYNHDEVLPYTYNIVSLDKVTDVVDTYAGAGVMDFTAYEWLRTKYNKEYEISVIDMVHGKVTLEKSVVEVGQQVNVHITPEEGYALKADSLQYNGIPVKGNSFIMPEENVVLTAEFENKIPVTGIKLNTNQVFITTGSAIKLVANVEPQEAHEKSIHWSSSDENVASVQDGLVTARTTGSALIIATTLDGGFTDNCEVKVVNTIIPVTGVTLNHTELELTTTENTHLSATVTPQEATNTTLKWSSSDENVVKVNQGVISPIGNGTAIITVTTLDGEFTTTCTVNVNADAFKPAQYAIEITPMINGQVTTNTTLATAGEKIYVTVSSSNGYRLKSNTLKYNDNLITDDYFIMPEEDIVITAEFERIPDMDSDDDYIAPVSDVISKNLENTLKSLKDNEKSQLLTYFNEYTPYTVLNGQLTLNQLEALTVGKLSDDMLQQLLKQPEALKVLGINLESIITPVQLISGKVFVFTDVTKEHWANKAIEEAITLGLVQGMPDGSFAPNNVLKVSDAFTSVNHLLLLNHLTQPRLPRSTVEKYLTNKNHWGFADIASVGSKLSETTLKQISDLGDKPLCRALLAQVLYEVTEGKLERINESVNFEDIADSDYQEAMIYCIQTGLLKGVNQTIMAPEKPLTRAELMMVLIRMNTFLQK